MSKSRFIYFAIFSFIGLIASFIITVEKFALLADPQHVPSCSLNPLFSCTNVMQSPEASTFGFPNPLIGLVGFSIILTFSLLGLAVKTLPRGFYWLLTLGLAFAAGFTAYLFYEAVFDIGAICLYCVVVWLASWMLFADSVVYLAVSKGKMLWLEGWGWWIGFMVWLGFIITIVIHFWDTIKYMF